MTRRERVGQPSADTGARLGEEAGRRAEMFGFGTGKAFKDLARWWDNTLGILSPVAFGVFGLVLVIFALFVTSVIASRSDQPQL